MPNPGNLTAAVGKRTKKGTLVTQSIVDAAIGDAAGNLIIYEDNSAQMESLFRGAIAKGLEEIGLIAEGYAKKLCPVDTGRLRNSITHTIDSAAKAAYIGTNVEYAPYVEFGTHRMKERPFLRPAASDHAAQYRQILEASLKS